MKSSFVSFGFFLGFFLPAVGILSYVLSLRKERSLVVPMEGVGAGTAGEATRDSRNANPTNSLIEVREQNCGDTYRAS